MRFTRGLSTAVLVASAVMCGCKVGPNYKRPAIEAPPEFRDATTQPSTRPSSAPSTQPTLGDVAWWEAFNDPALKHLLETALKNNYDLRIAVTRIEQARAVQMQARSQLFPQVGYGGAAYRGRDSLLGQPEPPFRGTLPDGTTVGVPSYQNSFLAALSVAWEIDLWGRIRRMDEAALAQYLASVEARRDIGVSLVASVAQTYFELLELDLERQIAVSTVANFQASLDLFTRKFEGGAASQLEVARAATSLASTAATIPELDRQILLQENQLSILLGANPGPIKRDTILTQVSTPDIPAGLPSQLLERRPDIRQAEQQVRAANAEIGVSVANFFPKLGLSALYGNASTDLSDLLSGSTVTSSIGASLTGPLFEGGLLVGQYKQAKASWKQTVLQYQQTALTAFREVSDALVSHQKLALSVVERAKAVDSGQLSVKLALDRYNVGKSAYFEVLDAQTELYNNQSALAKSQFDELNAFVQLYKSLGGGWNAADSATAPTTQPSTTQAAQ